MAVKRMFSKLIIDSDAFLDMPLSTQALYFHLCMRADDDGFINSPKKIMRMVGANENEFQILLAKNFIIQFEIGIIVITHWKIHNTLKKDRYKKTIHYNEINFLEVMPDSSYVCKENVMTKLATNRNQVGTIMEPSWNHNGTKLEPQYSKDKYSKDKYNKSFVATSSNDNKNIIKFNENSFEIKAVNYLVSQILKLNENAKVPNTILEKQKWAVHIERMKRLDNRSEQDIKKVLKFATEDSFWQSNILSTAKFRKKFDELYIKANKSNTSANNTVGETLDVIKNWRANK